MENEMEIFRAWLQKYVNEDKGISGVELAEKLDVSKATVSAYITGRLINGERKFTQIPFETRKKILEITSTTPEKMRIVGREQLSLRRKPEPNQFTQYDEPVRQHIEVVKKFRHREMALTANELLLKIDEMGLEVFSRAITAISDIIKEETDQKITPSNKRPTGTGPPE